MRQSGIPQTISTSRSTLLVLTTIAMILLPGAASAQAKRYPLESAERLRFHNVTAEPAMLQGKKGLKATISEEARRRMSQTQQYAQGLVCIEDLNFSNGVIEAEIAGAMAPGPGFGRRRRASTKRTSTLCQEHGRRSKSRCAVNRRASTSTAMNSRR